MLTNILTISSLDKDKQIYKDPRASLFIDCLKDRYLPHKLFIFNIKPPLSNIPQKSINDLSNNQQAQYLYDEYEYLTYLLQQIKKGQIKLEPHQYDLLQQSCCIIRGNPSICNGAKLSKILQEFWPNFAHAEYLYLDFDDIRKKYISQAKAFLENSNNFVQISELDLAYSEYLKAFMDQEFYLNINKERFAECIEKREVIAIRDNNTLAGVLIGHIQKDILYIYGLT